MPANGAESLGGGWETRDNCTGKITLMVELNA